jgi:signal transduction histidine kinase
LNPEVRLGLYRIAQEALRNLAKHAAVTECWMSLVARDGRLELTIRDEGIGFDPKTERRDAGIGLVSLEERARLIGARLSIISSPGQGTTVCVRVRPQEANR